MADSLLKVGLVIATVSAYAFVITAFLASAWPSQVRWFKASMWALFAGVLLIVLSEFA